MFVVTVFPVFGCISFLLKKFFSPGNWTSNILPVLTNWTALINRTVTICVYFHPRTSIYLRQDLYKTKKYPLISSCFQYWKIHMILFRGCFLYRKCDTEWKFSIRKPMYTVYFLNFIWVEDRGSWNLLAAQPSQGSCDNGVLPRWHNLRKSESFFFHVSIITSHQRYLFTNDKFWGVKGRSK